jgi:hypothetical protein
MMEFELPRDFAIEPFKSTYDRIRDASFANFEDYVSSWLATEYRFCVCAEHDRSFTYYINRIAGRPVTTQYILQRELFGFFVNGLAALESCCYSLFIIGVLLNPHDFPRLTPQVMQSITPDKTTKQFKQAFSNASVTTALDKLITTQEFKEWKRIRNIIAHRLLPATTEYVSNDPVSPKLLAVTWLDNIILDTKTTTVRRAWLAGILSELLDATDKLTATYLR